MILLHLLPLCKYIYIEPYYKAECQIEARSDDRSPILGGGTYNGMLVGVSDYFAINADDGEQDGIIKSFDSSIYQQTASSSRCPTQPR